jgi:hypothetical protein
VSEILLSGLGSSFTKHRDRIDWNQMSTQKHDVESEGAKPRDHVHPRHHFWKRAHRDWRVQLAVVLMLALILVYVMTDNLAFRPGKHAVQPTPAENAP